jgi:hypothetical protein
LSASDALAADSSAPFPAGFESGLSEAGDASVFEMAALTASSIEGVSPVGAAGDESVTCLASWETGVAGPCSRLASPLGDSGIATLSGLTPDNFRFLRQSQGKKSYAAG